MPCLDTYLCYDESNTNLLFSVEARNIKEAKEIADNTRSLFPQVTNISVVWEPRNVLVDLYKVY